MNLDEWILLEGVWDTMKEKFGNDKVAKFRQLKDGNQLPSGGEFEQKKNPQYWNNKTVDEFNEYLNGVIEGNFYSDRQKEELTSKLRTKLSHTVNVSAANELARAFWEYRDDIPDQEQRNIKYWIQNQNVSYSDLVAVLQPIQARRSNALGRYDTVYESEFMVIYKVYDWIAARKLSKGVSWCITGRYSEENGDGSGFFKRYLPENGKEEGSQYHYYYIVHDLTHPITYRGGRIRSHTNNTPQQYCMVINDQGQIIEVWEPGDTEIKKIPWIPVEHQVQPIPGVTIPYGNWANWSEPARVDLAGNADGFTSDFVIEDGVLVRCNIPTGIIYIPETVTKIGKQAFSGSKITQVVIPNSVKRIGQGAFSNCTSLKSIEIPSGVAMILSNTFFSCESLQSVTIPNSVRKISKDAFAGCRSLESITIPEGVTEIGSNAFGSCTSLQSITIPAGITEISSYTFYDCRSLQSITIPSSVTKIGDSAFFNCWSLKSVVIPDSVTEIGTYAFYNCAALQNISISSGITKIQGGAFEYCTSLKSVVIPDSVTEIGNSAFENCSSLENIEIPNSVTKIDYDAFYKCTSLKSATIPNSVTEIFIRAFNGCSSLKSVTIQGNTNITLDPAIFNKCHEDLVVNTDNRIVINYCIRNNINYQRITPQQGEEEPQPEDDIASHFRIENGVLVKCNVNSGVVNIPNTVTKIGREAFKAKGITQVIIPDSVTEIDDLAFHACTSLESVTIPNSVTKIGGSAFYSCSALQNIVIPDSVTEIGYRAFEACASLQSAKIPGSITQMGNLVFSQCTSLHNVEIKNGITWLPAGTFYHCTSLKSITIPNSVTILDKWAFRFCESLQNVVIPNSVIEIGRNAFANCDSLRSITIPDSVTKIGAEAFWRCESLNNVVIPNSVKKIDYSAFGACSSLKSVTIPDSVTDLGRDVFNNCHQDLVINTNNQLVIDYCIENNIHWQRITPQHTEEPNNNPDEVHQTQRVDRNLFNAAAARRGVLNSDEFRRSFNAVAAQAAARRYQH